MSKDRWVPIVGYEGLYEISNRGQVRTTARKIVDNEGNIVRVVESSILPVRQTNQTPKPYVVLHDGSKYHKEEISSLLNRCFTAFK